MHTEVEKWKNQPSLIFFFFFSKYSKFYVDFKKAAKHENKPLVS